MRQKHMIAFFGFFGVTNIGNDSTLKAILYHLRQREPQTELLCITRSPESALRLFEIPAMSMDAIYNPDTGINSELGSILIKTFRRVPAEIKRILRAFQELRNVERLIIPGTGALVDFGESPTSRPYSLLLWCAVARLSGVQVEFVSVGANRIDHPISRFFIFKALRLANYRSYRDADSKEYLKRIGFQCDTDSIYPDLVFSYPLEAIRGQRPPTIPPTVVGLGVMGYYGWRDDPVSGASIYQAYIANMSRFAIWSINQGYKIRFLIGQNKDQRAVNDILSVVTRDINSPDEAIFATMIETSEELIHAISETDIVIATRFHNAIFAIMLGRPVITIGYSSKFESLLSDIGLAGYSQQIEQLDIELLKSQFESVVQHYVEIQELILKKSQRYRQLLDKQYDDLFPLCQEPDSEKLRQLQVT